MARQVNVSEPSVTLGAMRFPIAPVAAQYRLLAVVLSFVARERIAPRVDPNVLTRAQMS